MSAMKVGVIGAGAWGMALALVASGAARLEGGRTVFEGPDGSDAEARLFSPSLEQVRSSEETDLEHLARFTP